MFVKIFDENHERDLEYNVNDFLKDYDDEDIVDIKYSVATLYDGREQIYCFTCMIVVKD